MIHGSPTAAATLVELYELPTEGPCIVNVEQVSSMKRGVLLLFLAGPCHASNWLVCKPMLIQHRKKNQQQQQQRGVVGFANNHNNQKDVRCDVWLVFISVVTIEASKSPTLTRTAISGNPSITSVAAAVAASSGGGGGAYASPAMWLGTIRIGWNVYYQQQWIATYGCLALTLKRRRNAP